MRMLRAWFLRVAGLFGRELRDRELSAEMESHLELHVEDNLRRGMSPAEARREAVMKLAWSDLRQARQYIEALKAGGAPAGFYAFTALSQQLAEATLERLQHEGAGAKVPRTEVFEILARVQAAASS